MERTATANPLTIVSKIHSHPPKQFRTLDASDRHDDKYNVAPVAKVTKGFKCICSLNGGVYATSPEMTIPRLVALTGRSVP